MVRCIVNTNLGVFKFYGKIIDRKPMGGRFDYLVEIIMAESFPKNSYPSIFPVLKSELNHVSSEEIDVADILLE